MASPIDESPRTPCSGSPGLFYSEVLAEQEAAKTVCRSCPFRAKCLRRAFDLNASGGVWGGFDETERSFYVRLYGEDVGPIVRELPVALVAKLRRNKVMQQDVPPDQAMEA